MYNSVKGTLLLLLPPPPQHCHYPWVYCRGLSPLFRKLWCGGSCSCHCCPAERCWAWSNDVKVVMPWSMITGRGTTTVQGRFSKFCDQKKESKNSLVSNTRMVYSGILQATTSGQWGWCSLWAGWKVIVKKILSLMIYEESGSPSWGGWWAALVMSWWWHCHTGYNV